MGSYIQGMDRQLLTNVTCSEENEDYKRICVPFFCDVTMTYGDRYQASQPMILLVTYITYHLLLSNYLQQIQLHNRGCFPYSPIYLYTKFKLYSDKYKPNYNYNYCPILIYPPLYCKPLSKIYIDFRTYSQRARYLKHL